jgi:hypothetical protein
MQAMQERIDPVRDKPRGSADGIFGASGLEPRNAVRPTFGQVIQACPKPMVFDPRTDFTFSNR